MVQVRVINLSWMLAEQGSQAQLFNFIRKNLENLHGSLLLDAMF